MAQGGRTMSVLARAARRSGNSAVAVAWHGGDVEAFVHTPLARVSWTRGGAQGSHATRVGLPAHAA
jgi:hypothetical protein